jgi:hypothetical protein
MRTLSTWIAQASRILGGHFLEQDFWLALISGCAVIRAKDYPFGNITLLSCQSVSTPGSRTPE